MKYDIETDWDYAYLTVNGIAASQPTCRPAPTPTARTSATASPVTSGGAFVDLTADLSAYAGQTVSIGFRYWTDGAVANPGFFVDDIAISGQPLDDAETDPGWSYAGFARSGSVITQSFFNAYFAEYRNYRGYDDGLRTGPYNFGFLDNPALGNWVEHFPYQDGLLVWYYDTSFADNNVGDNCAGGRCGGLSCRSTPIRTSCSGRTTARSGGRGSRRTTRPSGWRRPTGSACTSTASKAATAA